MIIEFRQILPLIIAFLVAGSFCSGCLQQQQNNDQVIRGEGTVVLVTDGGGFFGIVTDDGLKYNPLNLEDRYKVNGARVVFTAQLEPEAYTLVRWGMPVRILEIEMLPG